VAVYTRVTQAQLQDFLALYDLGELIAFSGIADGIENTNYRIQTKHGNFILTLYENLPENDARKVFCMLAYLQTQDIPVPLVLNDQFGQQLNKLGKKSAALFSCLAGHSIVSPRSKHCYAVGWQLARLHLAAKNVAMERENPKNLSGLAVLFQQLQSDLERKDASIIEAELEYQYRFNQDDLPGGVIHADLFRDNVLFIGDELSGVIDFYSSCRGEWLYDIAVTINDWCKGDVFGICNKRKDALLDGYQSVRPLEEIEITMLPMMLRRAALRFWLSRLSHVQIGQQGIVGAQKDPREFRSLLKQYIASDRDLVDGRSSVY
jgi:homoserine kinase type II